MIVLIMKERLKPLFLQKQEALLRRLPKIHKLYPKIERDYKKSLAGYKGEKSIDYFLSYLKEEYLIFHNVRLLDRKHYFQMDTLIITPSFACILEVKNIAGSIYINEETDQMIRTLDGKEEGFLSPLIQVRRQQDHFSRWLKEQKIPNMPCIGFVVLSNPSTILKSSNSLILQAASIPSKFLHLENKYKEIKLKKQSINRLSARITESHTEIDVSIIEHYQLLKSEILTGVQCPFCETIPLIKTFGFWTCQKCGQKSKNAHTKALTDYKLLFSERISNREVRSFLHIKSSSSAKRVLQKLHYPFTGNTKDRIYLIKYNQSEK